MGYLGDGFRMGMTSIVIKKGIQYIMKATGFSSYRPGNIFRMRIKKR